MMRLQRDCWKHMLHQNVRLFPRTNHDGSYQMNFAELTQFKTLSSNEPLITDFESMAMDIGKQFVNM